MKRSVARNAVARNITDRRFILPPISVVAPWFLALEALNTLISPLMPKSAPALPRSTPRERPLGTSGQVHDLSVPEQSASVIVERNQIALGRPMLRPLAIAAPFVMRKQVPGPVMVFTSASRTSLHRLLRSPVRVTYRTPHTLIHKGSVLEGTVLGTLERAYHLEVMDVSGIGLFDFRKAVPEISLTARYPLSYVSQSVGSMSARPNCPGTVRASWAGRRRRLHLARWSLGAGPKWKAPVRFRAPDRSSAPSTNFYEPSWRPKPR